jgi:hypothetical protein
MHHTHGRLFKFFDIQHTHTRAHTHTHTLTRIKVRASTSLQTSCLSMIFTCKVKIWVTLHRSQCPYNITCSKHTTFYKNFTAVLLKVNNKCISNINNLHYWTITKAMIKSHTWTPAPTLNLNSTSAHIAYHWNTTVPLHHITTNTKNKIVVHYSCRRV